MIEDALRTLVVEGVEVGQVRLAPTEPPEKRRETNLGLGVVQLPGLLERFRPPRAMPPQERFLLIVRSFCTAMNNGSRNPLDENELVKLYMGIYGPGAFLQHQIRRAGGDVPCETCQKPYRSHKLDRSILNQQGEPYINRLCNGDLVKL